MTIDLITPEQFERARLAFAEAWLDRLSKTHAPGEPATYGLLAALATLGIKVVEG